ncbi:hypothetical protein Sjap_021949 [Stephania japonica]|uniref:Uncharacterized protein n=1 Tax=Stephania japonica TaxID=461633 RepID=A0AAP0ET94_9MAGN
MHACSKLKSIELSQSSFNHLRELHIHWCPAMTSIDLRRFPSLAELVIDHCVGLQETLQGLQFMTALEKLEISPFSEELNYFPFPISGNDDDDDDVALESNNSLILCLVTFNASQL